MMTPEVKKSYVLLHTAVLLWGFTPILGELIELHSVALVWWRMLLAGISMLFLKNSIKGFYEIPKRDRLRIVGIGIVVALHWLCFYGAIKYSNASFAVVCLATTSFLTSILEPIIFRKKVVWFELLLGLAIIPGVYIISQSSKEFNVGLVLGILAALLAGLFTILNKQYVSKYNAKSITMIEMFAGFGFISLIIPFTIQSNSGMIWYPTHSDLIYLPLLAFACTTLPFVISLMSLRHLSAFSSVLTVNLEPVYGVLLAIPILNEHKMLNTSFYMGASIIILAVFLHPLIKYYINRKNKNKIQLA
jgi:drug/metabolite transporter (DMT)-like permease